MIGEKREKKTHFVFKSSNCQLGWAFHLMPWGWSIEYQRCTHLNYIFTVGCCAPVRLRAGPFRGSGGASTSADVEQSAAGRLGFEPHRRPSTWKFTHPWTILYRPLPVPPRQHFRISSKFLLLLKIDMQMRDVREPLSSQQQSSKNKIKKNSFINNYFSCKQEREGGKRDEIGLKAEAQRKKKVRAL